MSDAVPQLQWPTDPDAYARIAADNQPLGIDAFLRGDNARIARTLANQLEQRMIASALFPAPLNPATLHRRDGRALRRYRGEHRDGHHTVSELVHQVALADISRRAAHRRSLRRPQPGMVYLGKREMPFRLHFWTPDEPHGTATLTIGDDGARLDMPTLQGPPGAPIEDIYEADTGNLLWQPAVFMLADMFEEWPSIAALEGADRGQ